MRRYPRLQALLEWEGEAPVAGKSWRPDCADPSEAGALSACLWELPLLAQHYHPHVAQAAASVLAACAPAARAGGSAPSVSGPLALPGSLRDLAEAYALPLTAGGFRPAPQRPRGGGGGGAAGGGGKAAAARRALLRRPASEEWAEMLEGEYGLLLDGGAAAGGEEEEGAEEDEVEGCLVRQFR